MKSTKRLFAALAAGGVLWGTASAAQAVPAPSLEAQGVAQPVGVPSVGAPAVGTPAAGAPAVETPSVGVPAWRAAPEANGFAVVRKAAAEPIAMYSPRAGELWVVERGGDDEIVLEHLRGGRWTTTRLAGQLPWDGPRQVIDGSARDDVWLAAGERIYRYDGRRWRSVPTPRLPGDTALQAVVVADVRGPGTYVATFDQGVFRYDGRRWVALGKPAPLQPPRAESADSADADYWPRFMDVRDGHPYVLFERFDRRAYLELYRYDRAWTRLAEGLGSRGPHVSEEPRAWALERGPKVTVLGFLNAPPGVVGGTCYTWRPGQSTSPCLTSASVSAGAERPDGTLVLGGRTSVEGNLQEPTEVPGRFVIRDRAGVETVIPGDPGEETIALAVEPRSGVTWAATRTGESYSLQRWAGGSARR